MAYTDVNRVFRPSKDGIEAVWQVLKSPSAYSPTPGYKPKLVTTSDLVHTLSEKKKS